MYRKTYNILEDEAFENSVISIDIAFSISDLSRQKAKEECELKNNNKNDLKIKVKYQEWKKDSNINISKIIINK